MAWVFKSLWDFAAGDWQEGQVYRGFSLLTSFCIQLHSSSSKGPSSWQPRASLPLRECLWQREECAASLAAPRSRIATRARLLLPLIRWGLPRTQPQPPFFTLSLVLSSSPREMLSARGQRARLIRQEYAKKRACRIRALLLRIDFEIVWKLDVAHCVPLHA